MYWCRDAASNIKADFMGKFMPTCNAGGHKCHVPVGIEILLANTLASQGQKDHKKDHNKKQQGKENDADYQTGSGKITGEDAFFERFKIATAMKQRLDRREKERLFQIYFVIQ